MRLLLLDRSFHGQSPYMVEGADARYLADVLRLPVGQTITARDRDGRPWALRLVQIRKGGCLVETSPLESAVPSTGALPEASNLQHITLFQCLTHPKRLEQVVRQATEIGARRIVLVRSRWAHEGAVRRERLEAQIKEAVQQSGSLVPTALHGPIALSEIEPAREGSALFCHQTTLRQRPLASVLRTLRAPLSLLIGPERGLDDAECRTLMGKNFEPVLLDTNILRAETAAVYALAIVQTAIQGLQTQENLNSDNAR